METKFTKGKWRQSHRVKPDGMYRTEVYDEEGKTICTLAWHKVPIEGGYVTDREANAKLIAAAPEMFEAIERLIQAFSQTFEDEYRSTDVDIEFAKLVLKKATE